jgi:hypothetical protein
MNLWVIRPLLMFLLVVSGCGAEEPTYEVRIQELEKKIADLKERIGRQRPRPLLLAPEPGDGGRPE